MKDSLDKIRWLVVALLLSTLPAMAEVRDTLTFDISDLSSETIVSNDETFMRLSIPDCDHLDMVGAPMLPVKYIRLSVPYNATDVSVTATSTSSATIIPRRIYPAQMPLTTNDEPDTISFVMDSVIYSSNTYWPSNVAELVGDGFYLGENRIVTVAVYPLQYRPNNKMLRKNTQVRLVVQYSLGGTPTNMLVRRGGDLRLQEQESAKTIVRNPEQVHGFAMTEAQIQHMPPIGLLPDSLLTDTAGYGYGGELQQAWGDRARYLIVTTRELAPSFKRLAALKRQKGYSVQIKCIEDILADPRVQQGDLMKDTIGMDVYFNDDPAKLRQYLRLSHDMGNTQFVLLGGKDIPFRSHVSQYIKNHVVQSDSIPTDWYYSDLTSRWNINGCITELTLYYYDTPLHDLLVGRLMAENGEQIENYTDKLLRYELNPGKGDVSYLDRCLIVEGSELNPRISTGTIMANAYSQITPDTTLIIQRNHDYPTGGEIISLINDNQYGILSIHGHGSPYATAVNDWNYWYLDGDRDTIRSHYSYQRITSLDEYYSDINNGLNCLTNKYHPGIYYSWSCDNAPFDNFQRSFFKSYDCNMAQSYILGKDYGGVAFLGNTRAGYFSDSDTENLLSNSPKLEKMFTQLISNGTYRISEAETISKENYFQLPNDVYDCGFQLLLTHNLHGDPEFEIWPGAPQSFFSVSVSRSDNSVTVTGIPIQDSVVVALMSNLYSPERLVSANGHVTFNNVNPNSTIMVYHHNYLPYIAPLYLQNERIEHSQYVIANDVWAGKNVDSGRTSGNLTIAAGVEYELDAKGQVVLAPGFIVEKGALFSVSQSDY